MEVIAMRNKIGTAIFAALGMLVLILDGTTAVRGASDGIELCIKSVIPSLFPFFVLSAMLTSSLWGAGWLQHIGRLIRMPSGSESLLITGFLGGYPVGAQNIAVAYQQGQLSKKQAEQLLGFCNNAGPSFLFGIVAAKFTQWWAAPALWTIHIFAALLTCLLFSDSYDSTAALADREVVPLSKALQQSLRVMATVCGWVVLFRILIAFISRWLFPYLSKNVTVWVIGILELANGCCSLDAISDPQLRFVTASVLLALGGICVAMQTRSVAGDLSLKTYYIGKLTQGMISLAISVGVIFQLYWLIPAVIAAIFLFKYGKNVWKLQNSWYIIRKNGS
jgi:hypothetical protein